MNSDVENDETAGALCKVKVRSVVIVAILIVNTAARDIGECLCH